MTETPVPSFTASTTPVPPGEPGKPVIYPNPAEGGTVQIHIPGRATASDIQVQIYTVAFRLVQQQVFPQVPVGTDIQIDLKDKWGHSLARGLYYVVVTSENGKSIAKLLIVR